MVFLRHTNCHPERSEGSRVHPLYVFRFFAPLCFALNDNMVEVLLFDTPPSPLKREILLATLFVIQSEAKDLKSVG